jgi:rhodanese-related sulfurtransferase
MPAALAGFAVAAVIVGVIFSRFHHDVMRTFEAKDRLRHGGVLLDVDREGDFVERHPRLAMNIPLDELAQRADELGSKNTPVVVYAHRWRDGMKAVHLLRSLGFQDVFDAAGVRVKEKLREAAAHADAARIRRHEERGIPEDIELAPEAP